MKPVGNVGGQSRVSKNNLLAVVTASAAPPSIYAMESWFMKLDLVKSISILVWMEADEMWVDQ